LTDVAGSGNVGAMSEPRFFLDDVRPHKFLVGFREVDDALDEPDNASKAAGDNGDHDSNQSTGRIAQNKTVNSQTTKKNSENARENFFVCTSRFVIHQSAFFQERSFFRRPDSKPGSTTVSDPPWLKPSFNAKASQFFRVNSSELSVNLMNLNNKINFSTESPQVPLLLIINQFANAKLICPRRRPDILDRLFPSPSN
jgi:hypothetical protein